MPKQLSRFRRFCFTSWNREPDYLRKLEGYLTRLPEGISYIVFQTEEAPNPATGRDGLHVQGYCECQRQFYLNTAKALFDDSVHIERAYGSQAENIAYCTKEETRVDGIHGSNGIPKRQGQRTDCLKSAALSLKAGASLDELEDECPGTYLNYENKIISKWIELQGKRHLPPSRNNVHIYVGPTGAGKTTTAWRMYPEAYKGVWPTGGRWWWPNYRGQETVIFDEFRENISYQDMLALFDIHPMSIEYKGGNMENISKKIIVTTSRDPKEWYKKVEDKSELERRINSYCTIWDFKMKRKGPRAKPRWKAFSFNAYEPPSDFSSNAPYG